jgi:uncharacterized protein (TIGR00251 family)
MRLAVRVIPNASKNEFAEMRENERVLRLTAPAVDGKANKAAIAFLAGHYDVSRSRVVLVSGEKSRHKIFEIVGFDASDVE